jgi:hypothetical protein
MSVETSEHNLVRTRLMSSVRALLVGPLSSAETLESAPGDTYLTGILWPKGEQAGPAEDDDGGGASSMEESGQDSSVPGYRSMKPCSIGLTFSVKPGARVVIQTGTTARYHPSRNDAGMVEGRVASTQAEADPPTGNPSAQGSANRVWVRRQLDYQASIVARGAALSDRLTELKDAKGASVRDGGLTIHVRRRPDKNAHVITVTLINDASEESGPGVRDAGCLFQTELVISADLDGEPAILARQQLPVEGGDADSLSNALLYRDVAEYAVGHGISAVWDVDPNGCAGVVRTSWMPEAPVAGTSAKGHGLLDDFLDSHPGALNASYLGEESNRATTVQALTRFSQCYSDWIEQSLAARVSIFPGSLQDAAQTNLNRCLSTAARIDRGVELLRTDDCAWTAFAMANRAMNRQSLFPGKGSARRDLVWRPFQLAFMLLVMPGLVDGESTDRDCMDLLWFPTGGGKTEAYLALTAFAIFHMRLTDDGRRDRGGVDVLMRYTLRLLTVQQFQRAAALICACELMRSEDRRLGAAPITLGLYVGKETTPNDMEAARRLIDEERAGQQPKSTPRQLLNCPVCGSDLRGANYRADPIASVINICCTNPQCETAGAPLPVLTVDELIYNSPPSLLIGTVDKFAQIPRQVKIRQIFGLDGNAPPCLIIQDELHLISGPLGSITGLYETIFDALATKGGVRPKIIGSTATIGHASDQVRSLFDRDVLQFPPPGFDASDSFFAVRDHSGPDRLYIGIPTAGRSPKFALQAVVAALLQSANQILESGGTSDAAIDAYWTCVAYFNSLRELGGAYVLMQDDVPRQMEFLAGRLGVERRQLEGPPIELSSRKSSRELPELLNRLSATLQDFRKDFNEHPQPEYAVLASNMISVGVDVPRLGLMVVNGQPKSTAEYIQASSRVGRGIPGLVFTLYNFGRPRDLSHFEHFRAYHSALYRNVEATSVTPWAPRARDKALHAVFVSLVRHIVANMQGDGEAARFNRNDPDVIQIKNYILERVRDSAGPAVAAEAAAELDSIIGEWTQRATAAKAASTGGTAGLEYWQRNLPFGRIEPSLMQSAEEAVPGRSGAWPTPNSMREVEPSTAFILKTIAPPQETD